MSSKHDVATCLADMIENAERIEGYIAGLDRDAFARNGMVRDAVERCLERVCEAAHRLSRLVQPVTQMACGRDRLHKPA